MARVTEADVKQIGDFDASIESADWDVFITHANLLTNRVAAAEGAPDATTLKEIERLLAAHFVACLRDPRASQERAGAVAQTLQSKVDYHFRLSHYGQMAMTLDTTGTLAAIQKEAEGDGAGQAGIYAMGPVSSANICAGCYNW